ncbi:MAG: hypothetical protein ACRDP8_02975, partial [Actinopolymorphaceae bacterium]
MRIGNTEWDTSLFPKDGRYLVPARTERRMSAGIGRRPCWAGPVCCVRAGLHPNARYGQPCRAFTPGLLTRCGADGWLTAPVRVWLPATPARTPKTTRGSSRPGRRWPRWRSWQARRPATRSRS